MIVLMLRVNRVTIDSFWIVLLIVIVLLLLWQFLTAVPITAEVSCAPGPALLVGEAALAGPLAVVGLGTTPLPAALGQLGGGAVVGGGGAGLQLGGREAQALPPQQGVAVARLPRAAQLTVPP